MFKYGYPSIFHMDHWQNIDCLSAYRLKDLRERDGATILSHYFQQNLISSN